MRQEPEVDFLVVTPRVVHIVDQRQHELCVAVVILGHGIAAARNQHLSNRSRNGVGQHRLIHRFNHEREHDLPAVYLTPPPLTVDALSHLAHFSSCGAE